jgi:hypothetical protein
MASAMAIDTPSLAQQLEDNRRQIELLLKEIDILRVQMQRLQDRCDMAGVGMERCIMEGGIVIGPQTESQRTAWIPR